MNREFVRMWICIFVDVRQVFYIGNMDLHQILMTKGVTDGLKKLGRLRSRMLVSRIQNKYTTLSNLKGRDKMMTCVGYI